MKRIYKLDDFKISFENILSRDVLPLMAEYERERRGKIWLGVVISIIILAVSFFTSYILLALIILLWLVIDCLYQRNTELYMPVLMRLIPAFSYFRISVLTLEDIKLSRLFPRNLSMNMLTKFQFFNSFTGIFSDTHVDVTKFAYSYLSRKSNFNIFQGTIVRIKTDNYFQGTICIRPRNSNYYSITDLKEDNFEKVQVKDSVFTGLYGVWSDNAALAEIALTKEFVSAFNRFTKDSGSAISYCSFYGNYIYVALTLKDFFNFCGLFTSLVKIQNYDLLYKNFAAILGFVNDLIEQNNKEEQQS